MSASLRPTRNRTSNDIYIYIYIYIYHSRSLSHIYIYICIYIYRVHLKRVLSAREYAYAVRRRADPNRLVIKQRRICFLWHNQSFNIHIYKEPTAWFNHMIVHVQASDANTVVSIPDFLDGAVELDPGHPLYTGYHVSLVKT
jgi:hypothetical protein